MNLHTRRVKVYRDRYQPAIDANDGRAWVYYCPCCFRLNDYYYWRDAYVSALLHATQCLVVVHPAMLARTEEKAHA